ncbi:MAG: hypothetical protein RL199_1454 [Pseudomonadota bacterium]|jgi:hypothetical protein
MAESPSDVFSRRPQLWAGLSLALAALAWAKLLFALPAFLVAAVVVIAVTGTPRRLGVVALALSAGAFGRFMAVEGAASIVAAGRRSSEDKALSRLRELAWAEERAKEVGAVPDGGYLTVGELTGAQRGRRSDAGSPFLAAGAFTAPQDGAWLSDGYRFAVYLVDAAGAHPEGEGLASAASHFLAYAWPADASGGARRAFFVDADDRICEARLERPVEGRLDAFAAFESASLTSARCAGVGVAGLAFKPWRKKQPRGVEAR